MKTVLITGCSSGYGLETARHFHDQGWNVVATMRTPRADLLLASERLRVLALDVTEPASIATAVAASGPIDVLVNNAGIGVMGVFEATPMSTIRDVFETNTFGLMALTQALLPTLRERRGTIINVTSSVVFAPIALVAAYTASKAAVEAFSEVLLLELADFGVRVKLVEPGRSSTTAFRANALPRMEGLFSEAYAAFVQRAGAKTRASTLETADGAVGARVLEAALDTSDRLRFAAGADAELAAATPAPRA